MIEQRLRRFGSEIRAVMRDYLDRLNELELIRGLEDESTSAGLKSAENHFLSFVHGENQNLGFWQSVLDLPRRLYSIQFRHREVKHHDVWLEIQRQLDGFTSIRCLAAHFPLVVLFQSLSQSLAHYVVVVSQQNMNHDQLRLPKARSPSTACPGRSTQFASHH